MDMKQRVLLLLTVIGTPFFFIPSLQAGDSLLPVQLDCPSCLSFGVQRFQQKLESPPFSLRDLNGNQIALNDFKGKPILLIFFASWCHGCKEDIPLIEKFAEGKKDQLTILTVAIDGEKGKRVQRFVKDLKITLPVLLDVKERIARTYGVRMIPTTFFINREGVIVGMIVGQRNWSLPDAWSAVRDLFALR